MTATEINAEIDNARQLLNGTSGELFTTALWTVQSLVDEGKFGNLSGAEAELIRNYYDTRDERIGNAVNVEVGQISGGNCVGGQALQPYSDDVYDSIATTYLQSALVAGFYPDTTTHFAVDAAHRGHCDPRCFDLNYFYSVVAEKMGHEPGTRYGAAAKYGTRYGVHNIWWDNAVCGGPPRAL